MLLAVAAAGVVGSLLLPAGFLSLCCRRPGFGCCGWLLLRSPLLLRHHQLPLYLLAGRLSLRQPPLLLSNFICNNVLTRAREGPHQHFFRKRRIAGHRGGGGGSSSSSATTNQRGTAVARRRAQKNVLLSSHAVVVMPGSSSFAASSSRASTSGGRLPAAAAIANHRHIPFPP